MITLITTITHNHPQPNFHNHPQPNHPQPPIHHPQQKNTLNHPLTRKFFQSNVSFHGNKLTRSELFRAAMREPAIIQFFCRFGTEDAEEQLARCRKLQTTALMKPGFHFHSYGALRPKSAGPLSSCKSSQLLRPPHGQDQRPATAIAGFRVKTTPDKLLLNSFSAQTLGIAPLRAGKTAPLGLRSTSPLKLDKTLSPPKKLFKKTLRPHQRLHPHPTFKPSRAHADRKERISKRTQQLSLKVSKACIRLHQPGIFAVKLNTERAKVIKNLFSELDVKGRRFLFCFFFRLGGRWSGGWSGCGVDVEWVWSGCGVCEEWCLVQ